MQSVTMSEVVDKYDRHRFDDIFYAYTQLFLNRCFVEVWWSKDFFETNFERVSAFPIEIVRPYAEQLLQVYGSGPLLHTIIAANLECEPMLTNHGQFAFTVLNKQPMYRFRKDVMGLIAMCGMDKLRALYADYYCIRCKNSIREPEMSLYESLRQHARDCEMQIDIRYLKPLKSFWNKSEIDLYSNFLHKSVAQTMLTKLGVLINRPKKFDELPSSALVNNRFDSLKTVLELHKDLNLDDDALYKIAQAGYHTLFNKYWPSWIELKKALREYKSAKVADRKITCFCCYHEVTLSSEFVNDPWKYHAMNSPSCIFLLMKMGWEYVRQVCESMCDSRMGSKMELPAAVIDSKWDLKPPTTPMGDLFDLRKGVTKRKDTELRVASAAITVSLCSVCCNERRTVALMSCCHIVTCVDCSFAIRECPLCRMMITGYMMPVFQPDGSFWKQPDCMGGNYFINLPCAHLVESCVPINVSRCPKAGAVEEDDIYCIVCGDSKLGKLKVYV